MSENSLNINDEVKNVLRGVVPPEPKLVGTYVNMVPITESNLNSLSGNNKKIPEDKNENKDSTENSQNKNLEDSNLKSNPVSRFPISAMNMEQLQQFMINMQLNNMKEQNNNIGAATNATFPSLNNNFNMNMNNLMTSSTSSNYNIPPVGTLDPNVLSSLGLNVQKPTLQPMQFPNMQQGIPNLCGIQGQDLNLAAWMQKQRIALALSEIQNNNQIDLNAEKNGNLNINSQNKNVGQTQVPLMMNSLGNLGLQNNISNNVSTQLTPQLAAFLGNPNLVPTKDVNGLQMNMKVPNVTGGFGTNMNVTSLTENVPGLIQPTNDISKIENMIQQQQQQYVNNQLMAAAQLLRQHGIQATIGTEPKESLNLNSDKVKKPAVLQKIIASKINPKIFVVPNALTNIECDNIIEFIQDRLEISKISLSKRDNEDTEKLKEEDKEDFCKSKTACIKPEETPLIKEIETRLGLLIEGDVLNMEPILVHKYSTNDYIKEHHDGDNRTSTIAVFLSDLDNGGELDFPYAGIKIKPKKGLAVIWPNVNSEGKLDYTTIHAVNKIMEGDSNNNKDSSYLLYLHINKEPVRLKYEASLAMQQVIQNDSEAPSNPRIITQVSYPISENK